LAWTQTHACSNKINNFLGTVSPKGKSFAFTLFLFVCHLGETGWPRWTLANIHKYRLWHVTKQLQINDKCSTQRVKRELLRKFKHSNERCV
jgi:hypothetical protein